MYTYGYEARHARCRWLKLEWSGAGWSARADGAKVVKVRLATYLSPA